jgi:hypothetical protein
MRTIGSLSSRQRGGINGILAGGMMGVLLTGRIDHRAYPDGDQAEGGMIVVAMQQRVSLDYSDGIMRCKR